MANNVKVELDLGEAGSAAVKKGKQIYKRTKKNVNSIRKSLTSGFNRGMGPELEGPGLRKPGVVENAAEKITRGSRSAFDGLKDQYDKVRPKVGPALNDAKGAAQDAYNKGKEFIGDKANDYKVSEEIKARNARAQDYVDSRYKTSKKLISGTPSRSFRALGSLAKFGGKALGTASLAYGVGKSAYDAVADPTKALEKGVSLHDAGGSGKPGLMNGLRSASDFAQRFATGTAKNVWDNSTAWVDTLVGNGEESKKIGADAVAPVKPTNNGRPTGANQLINEASGVQSGSLRAKLTEGSPTANINEYGEPGTGVVRNNRTMQTTNIDARGMQQAQAPQKQGLRDAQIPQDGIKLSGDGLFSSMAQIGLNKGVINQRNVDAKADALAEQNAAENTLSLYDKQISAMNAGTNQQNALINQQNADQKTVENGRLLSQDLSSKDEGIRQRASRTAMQAFATEGTNSQYGSAPLVHIINELDKGSEVGIFDDFMEAIVGQDQSISNDPAALLAAGGLSLDANNNVVFGGKFKLDLSDVDEDVQSFLINNLETTKARYANGLRSNGG